MYCNVYDDGQYGLGPSRDITITDPLLNNVMAFVIKTQLRCSFCVMVFVTQVYLYTTASIHAGAVLRLSSAFTEENKAVSCRSRVPIYQSKRWLYM